MNAGSQSVVEVCEEALTISTYTWAAAEALPMFSENRAHQRTSGRPYPNRVVLKTDRKEKTDRQYVSIRIENEYLRIVILPELGGRIYSATDKSTGYDFFYKQHVVKPAQIGLLGLWISGGVEFNWPIHHRPSTFMPVDYAIERGEDGSATVWLSEHDPMERMKGMAGIRLRPGEAMFSTLMRLYNRTPVAHSFLWWENAAVPVNKDYQIFFPPDVTHVLFHYRKSVTTYPIATGVYNGIRYGGGKDIRWHGNSENPTSYFSASTEYGFFGGYDSARRCGVVHVASRYTSPGKKLFTWAYNQLSRSWERALTDTDGPYAELMAGSYSDNQPDFAWIEPFETKSFSQHWYPIGGMGAPTCANETAALRIERSTAGITVTVQATRRLRGARIAVFGGDKRLLDQCMDLMPGRHELLRCASSAGLCRFVLYDEQGAALLDYREKECPQCAETPRTSSQMPAPGLMGTAQELYLAGLHLDQYRDPCTLPDAYWREALRRDEEYVPALLAMGLFCYKKAFFDEALAFLQRADAVLTRHNANPETGDVSYAIGLVLLAMGNRQGAYGRFLKAAWNGSCRSRASVMAASIDGRAGNWYDMREHCETALLCNAGNSLAAALAAAAELRLGRAKEAVLRLERVLKDDPLNHLARYLLVASSSISPGGFFASLRSDPSQTCLDLACDLTGAGLDEEARALLEGLCAYCGGVTPMVHYTLACLYEACGCAEKADAAFRKARSADMGGTFPFRLEELAVLRQAAQARPDDARAQYLMGCLLYDKGHHDEAARCLERSIELDPGFYAPYRNLAVACYSHLGRKADAIPLLIKALEHAPEDEQLLYEACYVMAKTGVPAPERLVFFEQCCADALRDDILLEWARALTQNGQPRKALALLAGHTFVPCEGGEHAVAEQHMLAQHSLGREALACGSLSAALERFRAAQILPENLGAGLWHEALLVPHKYYEAECLAALGREAEASVLYNDIIGLEVDFFSNMHLPSLPYYQACALAKVGRSGEGRGRMEACLKKWNEALLLKDPGYFASTPFFISYCEDAVSARTAHFQYLRGLAMLYLRDLQGAKSAFQSSLQLDPANLYCWIELRYLRSDY